LQQYPNKGVGFKVRLPSWKSGKFYVISQVTSGVKYEKEEVFGYLYENNVKVSEEPMKISNAFSNYEWEHELGKEEVKLDNGLVYSMTCMMPFYLEQAKNFKA